MLQSMGLQIARHNLETEQQQQYTSYELVEFEMKNSITFTLVSPTIKYLGINVIKYEQDLYEKNYKSLMNKIKEELNERTGNPWSHRKTKYCQIVSSSQLDQ